MANITLFEDGNHSNVLLEDFGYSGLAVQANQHVISHNGEGMIIDPGGHKVYNKVLSQTFSILGPQKLRYILLSHQDPDIVAASNGWLMTTDAEAYISSLWVRFVPHFGLDHLVEERLKHIPDEGILLTLGGLDLPVIPAHFLHSAGNFHLYDPVAKILYTGDLGASLGANYTFVEDFDAHLQYMEGFHQRYMAGGAALKAWAKMARGLDIDIIAPQHGAIFKGKELVDRFITWCESLKCGVDLLPEKYVVPSR